MTVAKGKQKTLPQKVDRLLVEKVRQQWDDGMSQVAIGKEHGISATTVARYLTAEFDPYLDEVALSRARKGDPVALEGLTRFELREFATRFAAELDKMTLGERMDEMTELSEALGISTGDLTRRLREE